jgi:hypothetical protein
VFLKDGKELARVTRPNNLDEVRDALATISGRADGTT